MDDNGNNLHKKQGTRVFKKSSPNGMITTYLCKRDFIDSLTHVDPIEGVVLVDPDYVKGRKVFTHVLSAFRYGREDLDVLGLTFRKDLYLASTQVYPPVYTNEIGEFDKILLNPKTTIVCGTTTTTTTKSLSNNSTDLEFIEKQSNDSSHLGTIPLTRLQERLIKKLGNNAFPFYFKLPPDAPASVTLQPGPNENGKPCGVDYELRTYVAETSDEKLQKRNAVRLAIRKLTYAPEEIAPQPSAVVLKEFIMSAGTLRLEVSLNKEKYYHGESIEINVLVDNNSNKTVKKIKLSVRQYTQLCLHNNNRYSCVVDELETDEGFPILPSQTGWCKVYKLRPLLANNRHKRGLALDGKLKHEDTNLASSTIDVSIELPFTLTHPKPDPEIDATLSRIDDMDENIESVGVVGAKTKSITTDSGVTRQSQPIQSIDEQGGGGGGGSSISSQHVNNPIDDLIKLDDTTNEKSNQLANDRDDHLFTSVVSVHGDDDDLIFEDFARLRLKTYESMERSQTPQP
ncbi:unnamed protein product [Heterobilharzia americana]|nr:unnamed protein product [Heterobilharzia americana]